MKLLRYGPDGAEKPGMLDANGDIRCLSGIVRDIDGFALSDAALAMIRGVDPMTLPKEPIVFLKSLSAFCGPNDDVIRPRGSTKLDWECELGIVIGKKARYISEAEALDHVAGYCVCNDVSERNFQIERGGTWDKGKGCDTFGPTGPWMVTKDEIPDPQNLGIWTEVNGKKMQNGSTKTMIFGVIQVVSYVSHFITLQPGDVIATGTPPGVGSGIKPEPVFLKPGDVMRLGIDGLGIQTQRIIQA